MIRPAGFVRHVTSRAHDEQGAAVRDADVTQASLPRRAERPPPNGKRNNFREMVGTLLVTRDLQIPGTDCLGFRLIPTRKALGGEVTIPFVFRVRFAKNRLGLDVGGRF